MGVLVELAIAARGVGGGRGWGVHKDEYGGGGASIRRRWWGDLNN